MSGFDRIVLADPFRGGEVSAVMGGGKLDLRRAMMPDGETATLNVFFLMGGDGRCGSRRRGRSRIAPSTSWAGRTIRPVCP